MDGAYRQLVVRPMTVRKATGLKFVSDVHRRLPLVQGAMWATSIRDAVTMELLGVCLVGHPSREQATESNEHLRVLRCAVAAGVPNGCSMLYASAWRAARALGCLRLDTHTHADEPGTSLKAAGWLFGGWTVGGLHRRQGRPRKVPVDPEPKLRWWAPGSRWDDGSLVQAAPAAKLIPWQRYDI
jgi:hypothetical protein